MNALEVGKHGLGERSARGERNSLWIMNLRSQTPILRNTLEDYLHERCRVEGTKSKDGKLHLKT